MKNITEICKHYQKLPGHFKDNDVVLNHPDRHLIEVTYGRGSCTKIPDSMLGEFYLWLHPKTRQQILDGVNPSDVEWRL